MKSSSGFAHVAVAVAAVLALAGCVTGQGDRHRAHHPQAGTSPAPAAGPMAGGPPMAGRPPMAGPMMDMNKMCDMHRHMMGARTPEEQKAMMAERMPGMTPEMMQEHMKMMRERCK